MHFLILCWRKSALALLALVNILVIIIENTWWIWFKLLHFLIIRAYIIWFIQWILINLVFQYIFILLLVFRSNQLFVISCLNMYIWGRVLESKYLFLWWLLIVSLIYTFQVLRALIAGITIFLFFAFTLLGGIRDSDNATQILIWCNWCCWCLCFFTI